MVSSAGRLFIQPNDSDNIHPIEHVSLIRIDGLPNVFRAQFRIIKFLWLIFFLCFSTISLSLIVRSVQDYLAYQVITTYRLKNEMKPVIPIFTICNMNPFNSDYYIKMAKLANWSKSEWQPYMNIAPIEDFMFKTNGTYLSDEEKRAMTNLDSFIINCSYQKRPCNMSNFHYLFHTYFGNCLRFRDDRASRPETAKVSGEHNELNVEMYVGLPNELTQLAKAKK